MNLACSTSLAKGSGDERPSGRARPEVHQTSPNRPTAATPMTMSQTQVSTYGSSRMCRAYAAPLPGGDDLPRPPSPVDALEHPRHHLLLVRGRGRLLLTARGGRVGEDLVGQVQ